MTQAPVKTTKSQTSSYRGGLARSLVRTLLALTFIPLALMGGAAYFRARTLLRDQVVGQMRAQLTDQVQEVDLSVKTKEIRLDRLVRSPEFIDAATRAKSLPPNVAGHETVDAAFTRITRSLSPPGGKPVFNQYFFVGPDGTIQLASKPAWEGIQLKNQPFYNTLAAADHTSFAAFDVPSLYPSDLILMTVSQCKSAGGASLGSLVGITESAELQGILQNLGTPASGAQALFVTQAGTIVGTDPYTQQMTKIEAPASESAAIMSALTPLAQATEAQPASVQFTDPQGASAFGQVLWLQSLQAGIVYAIDEARVFGPLNSLIPFTIAILLAALAAMGGVLTLGASRVFGPLVSLAEITQRFSAGDFAQRAVVHTKDEIGLLADSFNHMAQELSSMYRSLEQKVEERTRQIRTAAAVAERITSTSNVRDLLNRTVRLLVEQFPFYQAGVFLLDRASRYAVLEASYGPAAETMLSRGHRLEVGSASIIGWVSANNQPRIASDVTEDPYHLKNELLPETRSEVGVPISAGGTVLGVLDVQSTQPDAFGPETVIMLQTLANQLAAAIQNMTLVESSQTNLQEVQRLHAASPQIVEAASASDALLAAANLLARAPYPAVILSVKGNALEFQGRRDPGRPEMVPLILALPVLEDNLAEVRKAISRGAVLAGSGTSTPAPLMEFTRQASFNSTALIPVKRRQDLAALIVVGSPTRALNTALIEPYVNMAVLLGTALSKISDTQETGRMLSEQQALTAVGQSITGAAADLDKFFAELHAQIRANVGDHAFLVGLYDARNATFSVPYSYQNGRVEKIDSFPLGEGLMALLIRTMRPTLLGENVEQRAPELGAKLTGTPPRSWMGVPLMAQDRPIGVMVVQDLDHEHAFDERHLRFLEDLSKQVAAVVQNAELLRQSRTHSYQLETAAEIARDISVSLDLDELLAKSVSYLRERFGYYHAAVFLIDPRREFAVIREATGEAGTQMKRDGHKLAVGSKSIVGYVAGRGNPLIVNDTANDATYYANPLLPETRSEAAIPLRVGERIVGVVDVQSAQPQAFQEDDVRTLQILADQLAVAVVNSELFAETQEHLAQHRLLHHITTSAASGATLEEAMQSAVAGLQVTLGGDRVSILLPDADGRALQVRSAAGYSEDILQLRVPLGSGITGWSAAHQKVLRVADVTTDPRYIEGSPNTKSELAIPLIFRSELLGVLNVESETPDAYTDDDEEMLTTLGGSLAAIIANARLLARVRAQAERERAIFEITGKIRQATDVRSVLATTATELTKAVGARRAQITVAPEEADGEKGREQQ